MHKIIFFLEKNKLEKICVPTLPKIFRTVTRDTTYFFIWPYFNSFLGYCIYRVRVRRGGRKRPVPKGCTYGKPKTHGVNQLKFQRSLRSTAEVIRPKFICSFCTNKFSIILDTDLKTVSCMSANLLFFKDGLYSNTPRLYSQWLNSVIYWLINHCTDWARTNVTSFSCQFDFHEVIYHNRRHNVVFTTTDLPKALKRDSIYNICVVLEKRVSSIYLHLL